LKRIVLVIILVIGLSLSLLPQATSGNGKVRGIVTDAQTGQPIEGVTIKLYSVRAGGYFKPSPKTSVDGKWRAFHIRGGMWYIDFEKVGYETKKLSYNIETRPGVRHDPIELTLKKIEGPSLDAKIVEEINKAKELMVEEKFQEALTLFVEIKEKYKELSGIAIVNLYMGNCYSAMEDYTKAVDSFKLALEKYPKNMELILSIGNAYTNMNDTPKAMEWLKKLPFEEIHNVDTLYNIGVNFYNTSKYDDAVKYFSKATEIDNTFAPAFYQLGMTYTALNKINEAVVALKRFMELDPDSPDYQTAKAIIDAFSK